MFRIFYILLLGFFSVKSQAWNAIGHQLVAQIAYNNLTPAAKKMCAHYLDVQSNQSLDVNFVAVSTWLDTIRRKRVHQFDSLHYIDIPFSRDHSKLPKIEPRNALWAIEHAVSVLSSSQASRAEKALNLRILIHVVGDIHQPLHTVTKISRRFPEGDLGGNLFLLAKNPNGSNLHQYWDQGAGLFITRKNTPNIKNKAYALEQKWSCDFANQQTNVQDWIDRSHRLAVTHAYAIRAHKKPGKYYQYHAQHIVEQQIVFSGCHLAYLINNVSNVGS